MDCLELAAGVAARAEEVCEITYDISAENEANAAQLYGSLREGEEKLHKWLHPKLYFARCRESARLQAAYLLAFGAWKALDHEVGPIKRKGDRGICSERPEDLQQLHILRNGSKT
jgi:hypothetical protein